MKLYTNAPSHLLYFIPAIVAHITQGHVEHVVVSQETQDTAEFKAKRGSHGKFPMLELADGSMIYESVAIGEYLARISNHNGALLGRSAFEEAEISQWVMVAVTGNMPNMGPIYRNTWNIEWNPEAYNAAIKGYKDQCKMLNDRLAGMVGQHGRSVSAFEDGAGKVKVGDTVWLAEAGDASAIGSDQPVVVTGSRQGRLTVRAV